MLTFLKGFYMKFVDLSIPTAKKHALKRKENLKKLGFDVSYNQCLELIAWESNYKNWSTLDGVLKKLNRCNDDGGLRGGTQQFLNKLGWFQLSQKFEDVYCNLVNNLRKDIRDDHILANRLSLKYVPKKSPGLMAWDWIFNYSPIDIEEVTVSTCLDFFQDILFNFSGVFRLEYGSQFTFYPCTEEFLLHKLEEEYQLTNSFDYSAFELKYQGREHMFLKLNIQLLHIYLSSINWTVDLNDSSCISLLPTTDLKDRGNVLPYGFIADLLGSNLFFPDDGFTNSLIKIPIEHQEIYD
jgi:hypothetical protein